MPSPKINAASVLLAVCSLAGAGIAAADPLYEIKKGVTLETDGAIDERLIAIQPQLVSPATSQLDIELTNGVVLTASRTSAEPSTGASINTVWRGVFDGGEGYRVTLTRRGSLVAGYFETAIGPYVIRPTGTDHRLALIEQGLLGDCANGEEGPDEGTAAVNLAPDFSGPPYEGGGDGGGPVEVDVLGLYTASARQTAGSTAAIETTLHNAVDVGNTALIDSASAMRFRLVHAAQFEHDDSGSSGTDISRLMGSAQVATLRDQVGADLVGLVVADLDLDLCGRASAVLNSPKGNPGIAHQVTAYGCAVSNFTYAHELGHLVGMNHDPGQVDPSQAIYPWAFGHFSPIGGPIGGFRTVMSRVVPSCPSCDRVGHFSNPDVAVFGNPSGIEGQRDNARVADLVAPTIAAYRFAASSPTGTLDVADCSQVAGWARDVDNTQPIRVRITHDGNVLATVVADVFRGDLPFPDQNHGFGIPTPPELVTGQLETVRAFALDVNAQGQETGQTVELSLSPKTLLCGGGPSLVGSYVPFEGAARTELVSTSSNPPLFDFYYEQSSGNFEQRPGGACHQGQNNPTYLKLRYEGPDIFSCSYQASWDSQPNDCSTDIVDRLNMQHEFVLNTDRLATDPGECVLWSPPRVHLPFNQPAWMHVDLTTTSGTSHSLRLNFRKFFEVNPL